MEDGDARVGLTEAAHAGGAAVGRAGAGRDEPTDQRGDLGGEAPLSQTSTRQPDTHHVPVPIHAPHGAGQQVAEMDGVKRALNKSEEASAHANMSLWRVLKRHKMHTEELLAVASITSVKTMLVDIGDGSTVQNLPSNKKKRAEKAMKFIVDRIGENPM